MKSNEDGVYNMDFAISQKLSLERKDFYVSV